MMILSGMHKFGALPTGPQFTHLCLASLCKPLYICVLLQSTVLNRKKMICKFGLHVVTV